VLDLPWAERGVIVAGDGTADPGGLLDLAAAAGWPVLAEPSSGARCGPNALASYQYLLDHPEFVAACAEPARTRARDTYSWDAVVSRLESIYADCLGRPHAAVVPASTS